MKDYNVLNDLVKDTQSLHREIFDRGYKQGLRDGVNDKNLIEDIISEIKSQVNSSKLSFAYKQGLDHSIDIINNEIMKRVNQGS